MRQEQWQFNFGIENKIWHWKQNLNWKQKHWHWNACIVKSCIGTEKVPLKKKTQALKKLQSYSLILFWYFLHYDVFFNVNLKIFSSCLFSVKVFFYAVSFFFTLFCHWFAVSTFCQRFGIERRALLDLHYPVCLVVRQRYPRAMA